MPVDRDALLQALARDPGAAGSRRAVRSPTSPSRLSVGRAGQPAPRLALIDLARHRIAGCDRKLSRHRTALEASADPVTIAARMRDEPGKKGASSSDEQLLNADERIIGPLLLLLAPATAQA